MSLEAGKICLIIIIIILDSKHSTESSNYNCAKKKNGIMFLHYRYSTLVALRSSYVQCIITDLPFGPKTHVWRNGSPETEFVISASCPHLLTLSKLSSTICKGSIGSTQANTAFMRFLFKYMAQHPSFELH